MILRVEKELYKKLNIIFISIFIINKYNPSRSAKIFHFLRACTSMLRALLFLRWCIFEWQSQQIPYGRL